MYFGLQAGKLVWDLMKQATSLSLPVTSPEHFLYLSSMLSRTSQCQLSCYICPGPPNQLNSLSRQLESSKRMYQRWSFAAVQNTPVWTGKLNGNFYQVSDCIHTKMCERYAFPEHLLEKVHQWADHLRDFRESREDKHNCFNSILIQLQLFHLIKLRNFILARYDQRRGHSGAVFPWLQSETQSWKKYQVKHNTYTGDMLPDFRIFHCQLASVCQAEKTGVTPAEQTAQVHGADGYGWVEDNAWWTQTAEIKKKKRQRWIELLECCQGVYIIHYIFHSQVT